MRHVALLLLAIVPLAAATLAAAPPKPDILLIMADDLGWSDLACYGSEIETPRLDSLAKNGLRFSRFYNAARCCPTRAALLTGLYPHQAGMGGMVGKKRDSEDPYQGYLNRSCVTLAEVLRPAGYSTYLAGKWHVGEFRPGWPVDRGFDHHFGLISGAMNYYDIRQGKTADADRIFVNDDQRLTPGSDGEFYATDAFTDAALGYLGKQPADRPFFLYLAYTAPHWPLHAPENLIKKYEERYLADWQSFREARLGRQTDLLPTGTKLSPPEPAATGPQDESERREMARKMATYAAMVERMDWNIGRVTDLLRERGRLDNTLILFLSDNGASSESGRLGNNFRPDLTGRVGTVDSYHSYGRSGASISNTPLRLYKQFTHEGGIRTPLVVHWPAGLKTAPGSVSGAVGHVIDLMPTLRELGGAGYPGENRGRAILPEEGRSLVPVFRGESAEPRTLGWEHQNNAAWMEGDLKLVRTGAKKPWELYDVAADPGESRDLTRDDPARAKEMAGRWQAWADRVGVR